MWTDRIKTVLILGLLGAAAWRGVDHVTGPKTPADAGRRAMNLSEYSEAAQHLEVAHRELPEDLSIVADLAECYDRLGAKPRAAQLYREAAPLLNDPDRIMSMRGHRARFTELLQAGY